MGYMLDKQEKINMENAFLKMNSLWTDDDEQAFKVIVPEELSNTEKILYETIEKERG